MDHKPNRGKYQFVKEQYGIMKSIGGDIDG